MIISFNTGKVETKGGSAGLLQQKKVTVTENGLDVIVPDAGYDGLSTVYVQTKVPKDIELLPTEINITENGTKTFVPERDGWNEVKINTYVMDESIINYYKGQIFLHWEEEDGISTTLVPDFTRCLIDGWEHYYYDYNSNEYQPILNNNGEPYISPFLDAITEEKLRNDGVFFYSQFYNITNIPLISYNEISYNDYNGEYRTIKVLNEEVVPKIIGQYGYMEDYVIENPYTNNSYNSVYVPVVKGGYIKFNDNSTPVILWHNYKGGEMTVTNNTSNKRIKSIVEENGEIRIFPKALEEANIIDHLQFLLINGHNIENVVWVFDNVSRGEIFYKNIRSLKKIDLTKQTNYNHLFQDCRRIERIENVIWSTPTSMINTFMGCTNLHTIDMAGVDMSNIQYMINTFPSEKLTNIKFGKNIKVSFEMTSSLLTVESLLSVIDGLYDFVGNNETPKSSQGKLTIGYRNLAKLTDEQKAIATDKGWILA